MDIEIVTELDAHWLSPRRSEHICKIINKITLFATFGSYAEKNIGDWISISKSLPATYLVQYRIWTWMKLIWLGFLSVPRNTFLWCRVLFKLMSLFSHSIRSITTMLLKDSLPSALVFTLDFNLMFKLIDSFHLLMSSSQFEQLSSTQPDRCTCHSNRDHSRERELCKIHDAEHGSQRHDCAARWCFDPH